MNTRVEALALRIERGGEVLAAFCETLTPEQWWVNVPSEGRAVGVLIHHVAWMYPPEMDLAALIASGATLQSAGIDWSYVNLVNASHANENSRPDQAVTIAMLRKNSKDAAERVRAFSDAQLDIVSVNTLHGYAPLSLQYWIEAHPIKHPYEHLEAIRAALQSAQA